MYKAGLIVAIVMAIIIVVLSNIKNTYSPPVASGCAGVFFFIFLWFIMFVLPLFNK